MGTVIIEPRLNALRCPSELNGVNREGAMDDVFSDYFDGFHLSNR